MQRSKGGKGEKKVGESGEVIFPGSWWTGSAGSRPFFSRAPSARPPIRKALVFKRSHDDMHYWP
jgi:hypothetical protein